MSSIYANLNARTNTLLHVSFSLHVLLSAAFAAWMRTTEAEMAKHIKALRISKVIDADSNSLTEQTGAEEEAELSNRGGDDYNDSGGASAANNPGSKAHGASSPIRPSKTSAFGKAI